MRKLDAGVQFVRQASQLQGLSPAHLREQRDVALCAGGSSGLARAGQAPAGVRQPVISATEFGFCDQFDKSWRKRSAAASASVGRAWVNSMATRRTTCRSSGISGDPNLSEIGNCKWRAILDVESYPPAPVIHTAFQSEGIGCSSEYTSPIRRRVDPVRTASGPTSPADPPDNVHPLCRSPHRCGELFGHDGRQWPKRRFPNAKRSDA
jgi:hypothetical protein